MFTVSSAVQGLRHRVNLSAIIMVSSMLAFSQGCVSSKKYNTLLDERDTCLTENQQLDQHFRQIKTEKLQLQENVKRLNAENELIATKLVVRTTGTALMHSLYEELVDELETEIAGEKIAVKEMKSGVTVHLPQDILFASGSAEVNKSGREVLLRVGAELAEVPYQTFVVGFTDDVPVGGKLALIYPTNWELAGARAASVIRVLEEAGVAKVQLRALSMGENMPIASNDTAEGRAKNRRIEIRMRPVEMEE